MYSMILLGALASSSLAQSAISFSNTTFTAPVKVGSVWPISYSAGDGSLVDIAFGNATYSFSVVEDVTAPGTYSWTVMVPVNVVAGTYQLALSQGTSDPVFSPAFQLEIPAGAESSTTDAPTATITFPGSTVTETTTSTVTAIYLPDPDGLLHPAATDNSTVHWATYIYYDDACACHHTSSCPADQLPVTPMSTTTVTYSEPACGCTTTIEAPCAETVIPMPMPIAAAPPPVAAEPTEAAPVMPAATNTPVAPTVAPTMEASPTADVMPAFTGAAGRLAGSGLGLAALVMAAVVM